jgi:hypothetical protein
MPNSFTFESEWEDVEDRSQGTSSSKKSDEQDDIKQQLTRGGETRNVFRLKVTAFLVMVLAGVGISVTVFKLTRDSQLYEFKIQYEGSAEVRNDVGQKQGSSISATIPLLAEGKNSSRLERGEGELMERVRYLRLFASLTIILSFQLKLCFFRYRKFSIPSIASFWKWDRLVDWPYPKQRTVSITISPFRS